MELAPVCRTVSEQHDRYVSLTASLEGQRDAVVNGLAGTQDAITARRIFDEIRPAGGINSSKSSSHTRQGSLNHARENIVGPG